jgi:predicted permease
VWTILGSAAGLLLASWGSTALVAMMTTFEEPIALETGPTWRLLGFSLALAFVTAAVCAIAPAFRATRLQTSSTLKEFAQLGGAAAPRLSLGKSLVVAQVALTVLLLFGAALFVRSLDRILGQNPGFDRTGILVISTDASAAGYDDDRHTGFYAALLQRLATAPGVESASLSQYPPISDEDGAWTQPIGVDGAPIDGDPSREVYFNAVTADYFRTLGIRLQQGRGFTNGDHATSRPVVVINEQLARTYFPGRHPIGHTLTMGRNKSRRDLEIVGVVADVKYEHLMEPTRSVAFLPSSQWAESLAGENLFAEVRVAGSVEPAAEGLRREIRALDGSIPIRIQTINDRIRASLVRERVIATLATTLGLVALALACAGLYGLLAYTVSQRTREIGLRLALGADRQRMLWMVLRQSLVLGAAGIAAGLAASLALGEFARNLLFQISETDPLALSASAAVMLTVALFAGLLPARRASSVEPVVALRTE